MKKKGLKIIGLGGSIKDAKNTLISFTLETQETVNLEEARVLIISATDELLEETNKHEENKDCYLEFPVSPNLLKIAIFANDEDIKNHSVSIVDIFHGAISYNARNPEPNKLGFITFHKETYEEAKTILAKEFPISKNS